MRLFLQGNNWKYLLPVIKFQFLNENQNSGKLKSSTIDSFPILTDFSDKIGGDIKYVIKIFYNGWDIYTEIFGSINNSENQYFPNG